MAQLELFQNTLRDSDTYSMRLTLSSDMPFDYN